MSHICLFVGLIIMAISICFAIKNRHSTQKWIANITVGIFFSTLFMIFPTYYYAESGYKGIYQTLYAIASSLFYSFKALAGRADLSQLENIAFEGNMRNAYIVVNYIAFIAAPVMASSLLLSFFGDTLQRIRYSFRFFGKCCIFSELNENSITLAESIKKERGVETIVFCNTKGIDEKLIEKARKNRFIMLYKSCATIKPSIRFGTFEYYLISETEDNNIKYAESIVIRENKKRRARKKPAIVNTFFKTSTKIEVLEDLASGGKIQLRFINEITLFCNDLVFKHPIYELPDGRKDISIMIVGCGSWGMQMLKTVIVAGQINGFTLKIRVYDIRAGHLKEVFYHQCPEIKNLGLDIEFIETNIETNDFFKKTAEESADATYVCVATSSDDVNLKISENLYRFFRRQNNFSYTPPIFVRVKDNIITENFTYENKTYLSKRKMKLFGTAKSFYADKTLFNTKLERLALGIHLCYCGQLFKDRNSEDYKNAVKAFYESYYDRKSSTAVAMHFWAKVFVANDSEDEAFLRIYDESIDKLKDIKSKRRKLKELKITLKHLLKQLSEIEEERSKVQEDPNDSKRLEKLAKNNKKVNKALLAVKEDISNTEKELDGTYIKKTLKEYADRYLHILERYQIATRDENEDVLLSLVKNEHDRWNYYMATEGYQSVPFETIEKYYTETYTHKDVELSKSHPCIIPFEKLPELDKKLSKLEYKYCEEDWFKERHDPFEKYDKEIVQRLPDIIRFAYEEED